MSKTEARQHFGSVHIYWHGKDHLLAWQGSLLGRDTDTATPYRSAKHSSSYSSAKN